MPKIPDFVALGVCGVALLLSIVGLAIPKWIVITDLVDIGLWQSCPAKQDCLSIQSETLPDSLKAVRAMVLLGMILVLGGLVAAAVKMFLMKDKTLLSIAACAMAVFAGVFMLIGAIIYATKYKDDTGFDTKYLHAGFALTIVAAILSGVSGVLFFVRREASD